MTQTEKKSRIAELVRNDPQAPRYHFIAPEGPCAPFDPNGAIFWKGNYHLFYIFQDEAVPHGGHCWGHASSTDLLHWTFHPTALAPGPDDPDVGIFSGSAFVNKNGVPTIIYHGVKAGTCIATAEDDDLIRWRKSPHNPVIPMPKEGDKGWGVYNVFDPHAWVDGDTTYVVLGGMVKPHDIRDTAYLFKSSDLIHWDYVGPFYNPDPDWTDEGEDCACPDFFKIDDRYMLLCISHRRGTRYYLGRLQNGTFVPEEHHRMNWPGGSCFAPESLLDDRGRRIFWAWVLDQRKGKGVVTRELGVMTLPRMLLLDPHGRLRIESPEELESLRHNHRRMEGLFVAPDQEMRLDDIEGDVIELMLEASVPAGGLFGLKVRVAPDSAEQTIITVDTSTNTLSIDTTRSSMNPKIFQRYPITRGDEGQDVRIHTAPFGLGSGEPLRLRIFLDKSILEVYANRRQCVTQRIYPTREDSLGLVLFSSGGTTRVDSIDAWNMACCNTD